MLTFRKNKKGNYKQSEQKRIVIINLWSREKMSEIMHRMKCRMRITL